MNTFDKPQVHSGCYNYNNSNNASVELNNYKKGDRIQVVTESNRIIVVLKGIANLYFDQRAGKKLCSGAMLLLPSKNNYELEIVEDITIITFQLSTNFSFCEHFSIEMLYKEKVEKVKEKLILYANPVIMNYLALIETLLNDNFYCDYFLGVKLKELFYLLRHYYSKQDLKEFFSPILSEDFKFSSFVLENYDPTLTVGELAKKTNYSISGFEKRFKKVFNISPSQWIQSKKSKEIYHEINCSSKTFAEIGYDFGFSSPSHFNNFCKKVFGNTPGKIRRKGL